MPTPIKFDHKREDDRDKLKNSWRALLRLLRSSLRHRHAVSYDRLVLTEWTPEQLKQVNATVDLVGNHVFQEYSMNVTSLVTLDHPVLPKPVKVKVGYSIDPSLTRPFPKNWTIGGAMLETGDAELIEAFKAVAHDAMDYLCIKEVLRFLSEKCDTFEQALYLFPHFTMVINRSSLYKYRGLEVRRSPTKLPKMDERMRRMMKHAHTLMGMHVLLDTFDNPSTHDVDRTKDTCFVTLQGNTTFTATTDAGLEWDYRLAMDDD